MYKWRKFQQEDYKTIAPWYLEHGWPTAPDLFILPTIGFIIEKDSVPICAAFLYITNSPLALLEWLVTKPNLGREAIKVLAYLMEVIRSAASGLGVTKVIHLSKPKYVRIFERKLGFKPTEEAAILVWQV